jgi:hypothetical protein
MTEVFAPDIYGAHRLYFINAPYRHEQVFLENVFLTVLLLKLVIIIYIIAYHLYKYFVLSAMLIT